MQFLVIGRMIDAPVVPPQQELGMLKATFEQLAGGAHPEVKAVYPFADTRATVLVIEVESADDLGRLLNSLPACRLSTFESHPVVSLGSVLEQLSQWQQMLAGQ
jgi:hypothetical protein